MAFIPPTKRPARPNLPSPRLDIPLKRPTPVGASSTQSLPALSIPSRTGAAGPPSKDDAVTPSLASAKTLPPYLDDVGYGDEEGVSTVRRNDQIQQAIASLTLGPNSNDSHSSSASPTVSIRSDPLSSATSTGDAGGLRWTEADLEDLGGLGAGARPYPGALSSSEAAQARAARSGKCAISPPVWSWPRRCARPFCLRQCSQR
jgi:hypothetical protein